MNEGLNRAARRLAEQTLNEKCHTIAILSKELGDKRVYQWGSNNGIIFSPIFEDLNECLKYPINIGLKPQEEDGTFGASCAGGQ